MDVAGWLRGLGLERYAAAFRENEINESVLPKLTAEDLKDLGVSIVGHRRMLLDAIASLSVDAGKAPSANLVTASTTPTAFPEDRAERRQITVMFSDLVGSTALSVNRRWNGTPRIASSENVTRMAQSALTIRGRPIGGVS
jgi:class 3 adenylate cyclase